jgi:hypothetical protein
MSTLTANGYLDTSITCFLSDLRARAHRFRGDQADGFLIEFLHHLDKQCRAGSFVNLEMQRLKTDLEKEASRLGEVLTLEDISAALKKMSCLLKSWMHNS